MPTDFLERLAHEVLLIDGAMGTQLQAFGLPPGESSEKFYLEHPESVKQIHLNYIEAGASILGGCCGTTPDYIKMFRSILDSR